MVVAGPLANRRRGVARIRFAGPGRVEAVEFG
jgi:hypothetical protein